MLDRMTGRSRGFCFVEMATPEGAQKALADLNGQDFEGRALRVDVAQERGRVVVVVVVAAAASAAVAVAAVTVTAAVAAAVAVAVVVADA